MTPLVEQENPPRQRAALGAAVVVALALALGACSSPTTPEAAPPNAPSDAPSDAPSSPPLASSAPSAPGSHARAPRVYGQITAQNNNTWTVKTQDGQSYTVVITPQTRFGSKSRPATKDQFKVGATVRVSGAVTGTNITATQVRASAHAATLGGR